MPVNKFVKPEVENSLLDNVKVEEQFVKLVEAVEEKKRKIEDWISKKDRLDSIPKPTDRHIRRPRN